jgi:hypothetical protein
MSTSNGWDSLDLSCADTPLDAGDYNATVEVDTISKPEVLWLKLTFTLTKHDYAPPPLVNAIAAKPDSQYAPRVVEGVRVLKQLAFAANVALPDNLSPKHLPSLFNGKLICIRCAVQPRDGVRELVVRKILPVLPEGSAAR